MKNKFLPIVIFVLVAASTVKAQIEVPAPTLVRNYSPTYGAWMQDPLQTGGAGKIWVIPGYNSSAVYEYSSMADLLSNNINQTYNLPFLFAGTGHVVYDGYLYFNKAYSNNMVKYNLATQTVVLDVPLPDAGYMNTYYYEWGGYSDIDFAVDGSGLWVMYSTDANSGRLVVSKLDPATLGVTETWNTSSEPKRQMGNAFIVDGIVYCIDSYYLINQSINYTYNTNTSTGTSTSIPWTNGNDYMTSCTYNPNNGLLYSWNYGGLYTYSLTPTISEITGATIICPGNSTILTAHSSAPAPEFNWYDAPSAGNLLYTGSEFITPTITGSVTYYVDVTSEGITSTSRTVVSVLASDVLNTSIQASDLVCSQGAAGTKIKTLTSLDYSWLATSCSGAKNLSFSINGVTTYAGQADGGSCTCTPGISTANVTDPAALAALINGDNTFAADFSVVDYQSWAFVKLNFADGSSQLVKIFESYNSNNGQDSNLCNGYQNYKTFSTTENLQISTSATGGQIDLSVTGNIGPFTYLWSNGATTQDISVTAGGTYSVVVTDACGLTSTESISVAEPAPVVGTAVVTHAASPSSPDGSVDLSVSGGTPPYSFLWNNGSTTEDIDNLAAGIYSCTISDSFGCTATLQVTVPESNPVSYTSSLTNASCSDSPDGSISISATGGLSPYEYSIDGGANYQASNIFTGLLPGSYSLEVKDDNGTLAEVQTVSITFVDLTPPNVVTQNISVSLDSNGAVSITPSQVDNGSNDQCGIQSLTLDKTSFGCSNIGANTVTLTVTDVSGNSTTGTAIITVVDNTPPVINCPAPITVNNDVNSCGAVVNYELPVVTDNCSGGSSSNSVVNGSFESGNYNGWQLSSSSGPCGLFAIGVAGQTINFGQNIFDYANNAVETAVSTGLPYTPVPTDGSKMGVFFQGCSSTHSLYQDVTLPSGSISLCLDLGYNNHFSGFSGSQFIAIELRNPVNNSIYTTLFKTLPTSPLVRPLSSMCFDISAFAGQNVRLQIIDASIQNYYLDVFFDNIRIAGGTTVLQTAGLPSGSVFPVGTTTNSFTATDATGNSSTCSFDVTVTDNQVPTVVVQNLTIQLDDTGSASITAADINNGSTDNCSIASYVLSKISFDCSNVGDNTVALTVTDVSGNPASATATVIVQDNIAPTLVTKNIIVQLGASGTASITAADINNGSTDNCSITTYSLSKTSFDCSNIGDNTVTLTATDASGNTSVGTAIVTVQDMAGPTVLVYNVTIYLNSSGLASTTVTAIDNGSFDNCGIAFMSLSKSNFDCTNVGANIVTLTVTDVNGNVSTANSTVLVVDNIKPVIIGLPSNITLRACDATATWTAPTASDNCSGVSIVQSAGPSSGDPNAFSNGSTQKIIYTATDASGNSTSAAFTVTRPAALTSSITTNNSYLHFGYSVDESAKITVKPSGGVGPYTVSVTMNRPLRCSLVSGFGDETWYAANATNSNNSCSTSIAWLNLFRLALLRFGFTTCTPFDAPLSIGSVSSGGALTLSVSLMSDAIITATIKDANGCITTNEIHIDAEDDRCFEGLRKKVQVCHRSSNHCTSICVDESAVAAHLAHGDYLGNCGSSCSPPVANAKVASDESTIQENDIAVEAYPNPFKSSIYVQVFNPEERPVSMNMVDLMGRDVALKPLDKTPEGAHVLDTEQLTGGMYFLQVKIGDYSKTVKLIKE